MAFSPKGNAIVSGAWDRGICLWRTSDGDFLRALEGHTRDVISVAFSPDGYVVSGAWDKGIRLWRACDVTLFG